MRTTVVVPCFNEVQRLDSDAFRALARDVGAVLFVDDGSTDDTAALLAGIAANDPALVQVLTLDQNVGKGEAVRRGLLAALGGGGDAVGYLDADLATPTAEFIRLAERLDADHTLDAVLGSRVALSGHQIDRHWTRHYFGRLYATAASMVLGREVYDTQCGAKVFRSGAWLTTVLDEPFCDRWSFDVELLGRLIATGHTEILEVPLERWAEVPGSKLGFGQSVRSTWSLVRVRRHLRSRASAPGAAG